MAEELAAGFELGHYRISHKLGEGGMADVYEAEDVNLGRRVALKLLPPALLRSPGLVERFEKEVRASAALNHPNIVTVYEVGEQDNYHFYTMPLLMGGDLRDKVKEGLSVEASLSILRQLAEAFDHAHAAGFVHRDVKPENVLFDGMGVPILTDFGIAKAMDAGTRMTATGVSVGTPRYISPEQARGRNVDGRADLYSLGVMFFEMLTGKPPFDAEESVAMILKHVTEPIPALPEHCENLQSLLEKLMAKEPDGRYSSARELIDAIDGLGILTSTSRLGMVVPPTVATPVPTAEVATPKVPTEPATPASAPAAEAPATPVSTPAIAATAASSPSTSPPEQAADDQWQVHTDTRRQRREKSVVGPILWVLLAVAVIAAIAFLVTYEPDSPASGGTEQIDPASQTRPVEETPGDNQTEKAAAEQAAAEQAAKDQAEKRAAAEAAARRAEEKAAAELAEKKAAEEKAAAEQAEKQAAEAKAAAERAEKERAEKERAAAEKAAAEKAEAGRAAKQAAAEKAEEERRAKEKAEADARAKRQAEEQRRKRADEDAKRKAAEAERRQRQIEAEAAERRRAEQRNRREAEQRAAAEREAEARRRAEEAAKEQAELQRRRQEEARRAEEAREAEEQRRKEAEEEDYFDFQTF